MKLKSFIVFIILFAVVPAFALSPDDSVIFYGRLSGNVECHFFQCDSSYPVDYQIFEGEYFISSPVLLNSSYRLSFVRGRVKEPFDLLSRLSNSESICENRYSL